MRVRYSRDRAQCAVGKDSRSQTAPTFKKILRAWPDRAIHPITRPAFAHSVKTNTLDFELLSDEFRKIEIARDHIPSHQRRRTDLELEHATKLVEYFEREKCDLPFVIFLIIEKAIVSNSMTSHTFNRRNFNHRVIVRFPAVMAEEIVTV